MAEELSRSAQRVQRMLEGRGFDGQVVELPASTRSAAEAAATIGCELGQIAKSLVFRGQRSGEPVLVIVSGVNRVCSRKVREIVNEPISRADADYVREQTGFSIGGVPPTGHRRTIPVLIDRDLCQYEDIWAAGGTPRAVFRLSSAVLESLTGGKLVDIKEA